MRRGGGGRASRLVTAYLAGDGFALAVLTLERDEVRPLERADRFHVRTAPGD